MVVLGYSCGHNANVSLISDKRVLLHYEKERFTRVKNDGGGVEMLIQRALADMQVSIHDVDLVATSVPVWPEKGTTGKILSGKLYDSLFEHSFHEVELLGVHLPAIYVPHHLGHMAYSFYYSGFTEADIISLDAHGNFTATAIGVGSGTQVRATKDLHPGNIGALWSMTSLAVFDDILAAGKVMGLAPFGEACYLEEMRTRYVDEIQGFPVPVDPWRDHSDIPWLPKSASHKWSNPRVANLAASVQDLTTEVILGLATKLSQQSGRDSLCLSGGVALNGAANEAVMQSGAYAQVFVPPAVSDSGLSLGFALYALAECYNSRPEVGDVRYLSRPYSTSEISNMAQNARGRFAVRKLDSAEIGVPTAEALVSGKTVALWFGRGESGPRALGHRSILTDPRLRYQRDYLNLEVKMREPFRPYGPSVLGERLAEVCDLEGESPYMLRIGSMSKKGLVRLPAVAHVDGTTRPQSVRDDDTEVGPLRSILEVFAHTTGCPAVLNTSFNLAGEPIVESPSDALRSFIAMPIDLLVLENWIIER